ncbi:Bgt-3039 [Blumeria graminis f. sp. tritici]|uniref:Bgt-3039 n=2 Tax=Blumeria graminis f. sp. tritici TaxID=62690 RepID=A0A061HRV4_BLUGR|nr:hypothetical protein BGT96224_3039 [Blumeria graminis f. sp. tritici 96224]VCU41243.1 Bgt-3039 [Blumeria graminis f. sp. tritici]
MKRAESLDEGPDVLENGQAAALATQERRRFLGSSDPISFTCSCSDASDAAGLVLLFYRYYASPPLLPQETQESPSSLAAFHGALANQHRLRGKIRLAAEGFNITVAGLRPAVMAYIEACTSHWSFAGLSLSTPAQIHAFFKPTTGCACVFGTRPISIRVCAEITPMGVTGYQPSRWDNIGTLQPAEFHERCLEDNSLLIDVRNHYESRIGYFVDGMGHAALRPAIRRFSQWPLYVRRVLAGDIVPRDSSDEHEATNKPNEPPKQILTYCTGGIRCEKGARFLQEKLQPNSNQIFTLGGGIAAYLEWMDMEIQGGRKRAEDSLFKGRNYVFDARGSMSLSSGARTKPVSSCHLCGKSEDRLSKCHSSGCHLVLVVCKSCELENPRCCDHCLTLDLEFVLDEPTRAVGYRPICECERTREACLWGSKGFIKC